MSACDCCNRCGVGHQEVKNLEGNPLGRFCVDCVTVLELKLQQLAALYRGNLGAAPDVRSYKDLCSAVKRRMDAVSPVSGDPHEGMSDPLDGLGM